MIDGISKAFAHLAEAFRSEKPLAADPAHHEAITSFAGSWHGDHLQNLLPCPMDGRRYVIEDWTREDAPDEAAPRVDSFSGRVWQHND